MINRTSPYRGLSTNQHYTKIQSLPFEIWNPLRNLLFTKEDMQEDTPADIAVLIQNGLGDSLSEKRTQAQMEYLQEAGQTGAAREAARENAQQKVEETKKTVAGRELSIIGA